MEKGRGKSLQAALVSVDPKDGALLAYVGGRDYRASQFDRVTNAVSCRKLFRQDLAIHEFGIGPNSNLRSEL